MNDTTAVKKVKVKLYGNHFAWVSESLLKEFTEVTGITKKPSWIIQKVEEDFGIVIEDYEDIRRLDKAVREKFYEDKAEWLKSKMHDAINQRDEILQEIKERLDKAPVLKDPLIQEHNLSKIKELVAKL